MQLSRVDQDLLTLIREHSKARRGRDRRLKSVDVHRLLGINNSHLAERLLSVFDADGDGLVSEAEFLGRVTTLILGSPTDRLRFVFRLHDEDGDGRIDPEELDRMLKACLSHNRISINASERIAVRNALIRKAGGTSMGFEAFRRLVASDELVARQLSQSVAEWFGAGGGEGVDVRHTPAASVVRRLLVVVPYYAWRVLLVCAYIGANVWIFLGAASPLAASHASLWLQVAGGAAACTRLNGMLILLPMIRSMTRWIRRTFLFALIPVDHGVDFHKVVGHVGFGFAFIHGAGHIMDTASSGAPVAQVLFQTEPALSGVIFFSIFFVMWLFALPFVRKSQAFTLFAATHLLYWAWFAMALVHSMTFLPWIAAPAAGFLVELLIRRLRRRVTFVKSADVHSTGVTHLRLSRPRGFRFDPGEYVEVRIPRVSFLGWHPFTISSAPEDKDHLGLHVRALGNWTRRLFDMIKNPPRKGLSLPAALQGPYGSPSTRVFSSRHAVLIGAGIGVTPFASILKSMAYRHRHGSPLPDKVHFFWLYRGQGSFEWFSDVLREVDALHMKRLEINICLTDARINSTTGLLKIGMDLVHGITRRDMLTGLKSLTSFGHPDWDQVFSQIAVKSPHRRIDVFFCGPYPLGRAVHSAANRAGFSFRMEQF